MTLEAQRRENLINRLARRIADAGMTAPAILFLEAYKPLSFLGAQLLWFAQPFLTPAFDPVDFADFALLVQDDAGTEALIVRLESFQANDSVAHG